MDDLDPMDDRDAFELDDYQPGSGILGALLTLLAVAALAVAAGWLQAHWGEIHVVLVR